MDLPPDHRLAGVMRVLGDTAATATSTGVQLETAPPAPASSAGSAGSATTAAAAAPSAVPLILSLQQRAQLAVVKQQPPAVGALTAAVVMLLLVVLRPDYVLDSAALNWGNCGFIAVAAGLLVFWVGR